MKELLFNPFRSPGNKWRLFNPLWWALFFLLGLYRLISFPFPSRCRFHPTCSTYARDALSEYGATKSIILSTIRLLKCNPFNLGGVDYVKKKSDGQS